MKKYKIVKRINKYDAEVYYIVKERYLLFFWTAFGEPYGMFHCSQECSQRQKKHRNISMS